MKTIILIILVLSSIPGLSQDWKEGHYYDQKGNAHYGQIHYKYYYSRKISFRDLETGKVSKIKSWKTKGFVIEGDSFTIVQDFKLLTGYPMAHGFAQVMEVGDIILLKNYSSLNDGVASNFGPQGPMVIGPGRVHELETFLLKRKDSDKLLVVYSNRKKFERLVKDIVKDLPSESKYKEVHNIKYEMMPELIREYNKLNKKL